MIFIQPPTRSDLTQGHFIVSHTRIDSCAAVTKMIDPVGMPNFLNLALQFRYSQGEHPLRIRQFSSIKPIRHDRQARYLKIKLLPHSLFQKKSFNKFFSVFLNVFIPFFFFTIFFCFFVFVRQECHFCPILHLHPI